MDVYYAAHLYRTSPAAAVHAKRAPLLLPILLTLGPCVIAPRCMIALPGGRLWIGCDDGRVFVFDGVDESPLAVLRAGNSGGAVTAMACVGYAAFTSAATATLCAAAKPTTASALEAWVACERGGAMSVLEPMSGTQQYQVPQEAVGNSTVRCLLPWAWGMWVVLSGGGVRLLGLRASWQAAHTQVRLLYLGGEGAIFVKRVQVYSVPTRCACTALQVSDLCNALAEVRSELHTSAALCAQHDAELVAKDVALAEAKEATNVARTELESANTAAMAVQERVKVLEQTAARLEEDLSCARADAVRLEEDLSCARADAVRLEEDLSCARADAVRLEEDLSCARADAVRLEEDLSCARADAVQLSERSAAELGKVQAERDVALEESSAARRALASATGEISVVAAAGKAAGDQLTEQQARADAATAELEQVRMQLAAMHARLETMQGTAATAIRVDDQEHDLAAVNATAETVMAATQADDLAAQVTTAGAEAQMAPETESSRLRAEELLSAVAEAAALRQELEHAAMMAAAAAAEGATAAQRIARLEADVGAAVEEAALQRARASEAEQAADKERQELRMQVATAKEAQHVAEEAQRAAGGAVAELSKHLDTERLQAAEIACKLEAATATARSVEAELQEQRNAAAKAKNELVAARKDIAAERSAMAGDVQRAAEAARREAEDSAAQRVCRVEEQHAAELHKAQDRIAAIESERDAMLQQLQQLQCQHDAALQLQQQQLQSAIDATLQQQQREMQSERNTMMQQLQQLQYQHDATLKLQQQQLQSLHDAALQQQQTEMQSERDAVQQQLQQLQYQHDALQHHHQQQQQQQQQQQDPSCLPQHTLLASLPQSMQCLQQGSTAGHDLTPDQLACSGSGQCHSNTAHNTAAHVQVQAELDAVPDTHVTQASEQHQPVVPVGRCDRGHGAAGQPQPHPPHSAGGGTISQERNTAVQPAGCEQVRVSDVGEEGAAELTPAAAGEASAQAAAVRAWRRVDGYAARLADLEARMAQLEAERAAACLCSSTDAMGQQHTTEAECAEVAAAGAGPHTAGSVTALALCPQLAEPTTAFATVSTDARVHDMMSTQVTKINDPLAANLAALAAGGASTSARIGEQQQHCCSTLGTQEPLSSKGVGTAAGEAEIAGEAAAGIATSNCKVVVLPQSPPPHPTHELQQLQQPSSSPPKQQQSSGYWPHELQTTCAAVPVSAAVIGAAPDCQQTIGSSCCPKGDSSSSGSSRGRRARQGNQNACSLDGVPDAAAVTGVYTTAGAGVRPVAVGVQLMEGIQQQLLVLEKQRTMLCRKLSAARALARNADAANAAVASRRTSIASQLSQQGGDGDSGGSCDASGGNSGGKCGAETAAVQPHVQMADTADASATTRVMQARSPAQQMAGGLRHAVPALHSTCTQTHTCEPVPAVSSACTQTYTCEPVPPPGISSAALAQQQCSESSRSKDTCELTVLQRALATASEERRAAAAAARLGANAAAAAAGAAARAAERAAAADGSAAAAREEAGARGAALSLLQGSLRQAAADYGLLLAELRMMRHEGRARAEEAEAARSEAIRCAERQPKHTSRAGLRHAQSAEPICCCSSNSHT
jgi:hypothetical protein